MAPSRRTGARYRTTRMVRAMRPAVRRTLAVALLAGAVALPASGVAQETPGPSSSLTVAGRKLEPAGRLTPVGSFPTGGALTPGGRLYWSGGAGPGETAARVVDVGPGAAEQALPIPGGDGGIAVAAHRPPASLAGVP